MDDASRLLRISAHRAGESVEGWSVPGLYWGRSVSIPATFILAALFCLPTLDDPIARLRPHTLLPRSLDAFFHRIETFGHGSGVCLILAAVWFCDPARRRCLPRLTAAAFGSGLAANIVKLLVGRVRPFAWIDQLGNTLPQQFTEWLPLGTNSSHEQSFPSAHTATAVGLALGLSALYPQGRLYFGVLATLVALQRVVHTAHYPSDVLFAAGLSWTVVAGLFRIRDLNRRFLLIERTPRAKPVEPIRRAA